MLPDAFEYFTAGNESTHLLENFNFLYAAKKMGILHYISMLFLSMEHIKESHFGKQHDPGGTWVEQQNF